MKVILTADGEEFEVDAEEVKTSSVLLASLVEDGDHDEGSAPQTIPVANVKAPIMAKVIEFLRQNAQSPLPEIVKPLTSDNMADAVPRWYADFVDGLETESLFSLLLAANYLDIKGLFDLTCAKASTMIKNKSPDEIREVLNIKEEFTPEEYAHIRDETRWTES